MTDLAPVHPEESVAAAQRQSEMRYRTLVRATSAITWSCPPSGLHIALQPEWMAFTGQTAEEMLGDGWTKAVHPEDIATAAQKWSEAVACGAPYISEHRIRRADGAWRWMIVRAAPIHDDSGKIVEWFGMNVDITERKIAEEKLVDRNRQLDLLVRTSQRLLLADDPDEELQKIFSDIARQIGVESFFFYQPTKPQALKFQIAEGAAEDDWRSFTTMDFEDLLCGRVAETQAKLIIEDLQHCDQPDLEALRAAGAKSYAGFPLVASGKLMGTIAFASRTLTNFRDGDISAVQSVCDQIATTLERWRLQRELRESEDRLRQALEGAELGSWDVDLRTGDTIWNRRQFELQGLDPDTDVASIANWRSHIHAADREAVESAINRARDERAPLRIEHRLCPDVAGNVRWLGVYGRFVFDEAGNPVRIAGISRDITERKKAEEKLAENEARLSRILKQSPAGIVQTDAKGRMVLVNERWCEMLRYTEAELLGMSVDDITHPSSLAATIEAVGRLAQGGPDFQIEKNYSRKDGTILRASSNVAALRDARGNFEGLLAVVVDLTERISVESRLRASEERLRFIAERAQVGHWVWEITTDRLEWSPLCNQLFGIPPEEPISYARFMAALHRDDRERTNRAVSACLESGGQTPYDIEYRTVWPDGTIRWLYARGDAEFSDGKPIRMAGIVIDITERKKAEVALSESESRFRQVAESLPQLVWTCASDGKCDYLGPQWVRYTGIGESQQLNFGWVEQLHPDDRERVATRWQETAASSENFDLEFRIRRHDGEYRWFRTLAVPLKDEKGAVVKWFGTNTDIHEAKQAEADRARLAAIVASTSEAIISKTLDGVITSWNKGAERIYGYSAEEMIGASMRRIVPPDRQTEEDDILLRIGRGERVETYETVRLCKQGDEIDISTTISPVFDEAGNIVGASNISHDITEKKRSEERERLLMREVNHRSKNMLALVQSIARQTASASPSDFLKRFEDRVQALSAAQDLLIEHDWKAVPLADLVRSQLAHFADLIGDRVTFAGPPLSLTPAAAQALGMTLHELATNAAKYGALSTTDGGVSIRWKIETNGTAEPQFTLSWIEHDGPPVEKPRQRGFGSAVTSTMLTMTLRGEVTADYAVTGLVWRIVCPAGRVVEGRLAALARETRSVRRGLEQQAGCRRVLVVEDEPIIAAEIAGALATAGFEVIGPAVNVEQALALIKHEGCDAAVLDISLGEETSEPIAHALISSGTPFIVATGFSRAQLPEVFRTAPLIGKPLQPAALEAEIRRCLGRRVI